MENICRSLIVDVNENEIGDITLTWMNGDRKYPYLGYEIYAQEHRNKGVMSRHLPAFLEEVSADYPQLVALVKKDNQPSMKLLEKNDFVRLREFDDCYSYLRDANIPVDFVKKTVNNFNNFMKAVKNGL